MAVLTELSEKVHFSVTITICDAINFNPYERSTEESVITTFSNLITEIDLCFKRTVFTLMRRRIMRRLIWVCTACLYPIYGTLGINGLSFMTERQVDFLLLPDPGMSLSEHMVNSSIHRNQNSSFFNKIKEYCII